MARLKKPKMKKFPKKPKSSASSDVLQRYLQKVEQIKKDHVRDLKAYETEKKRREQLRRKVSEVRR